MGMKQKRCPKCRKRRRFVEGGEDRERTQREQSWVKIDDQWVCIRCAESEEPS